MGQSIYIQIAKSGQTVEQLTFNSDEHRTIKIGRLTSAQIKIEDPKVARIHAVMECSGQDVSLIDMGSSVGTLVNGNKISKVRLNHGDQVLIGDATLIVGIGSMGQAQAAATAAIPVVTASKAAQSAPQAQAVAQERAVPSPQQRQPTFDPGSQSTPRARITQEQLEQPAVQSQAALLQEEPLTDTSRVLELRYYWGDILLGMFHYRNPSKVTIGEAKGTNIFISSEHLPVAAFPLIKMDGNNYVLNVAQGMEGEVEIGGKIYSFSEALAAGKSTQNTSLSQTTQTVLPKDARALVHWSGATFAMRFVPRVIYTEPPRYKSWDLLFLNALVFSLMFHLVTIIVLMVTPIDTNVLKSDLFGQPDRFTTLILEPPKETESTKDMLDKLKEKQEQKKEELKPKEKPQEKPDLNKAPPKIAQKPSPQEKQQAVRNKFKEMLSNNLLGGGAGGSLKGSLQNVIGTSGSAPGAGLAGLGVRSGGALTGGIGTSKGIGGIGTMGRLGGPAGYGSGVGGLGGGKSRDMIDLDTPTIAGALDPAVIKKVINDNKQQARYCYEVELQRNQDLEGRVLVWFVIGATGEVVECRIKESSLKNKNVEICLCNKVKTWKFPPPAGGGTVEVNYPFVFKAS